MGVVEDEPAVVYAQAITANPVADEHAIPAVAYGGGQAGAPPPFRPRGGGHAAVAAPQYVPQLQQPQFTQEQMTQMQQQQTQMQQMQQMQQQQMMMQSHLAAQQQQLQRGSAAQPTIVQHDINIHHLGYDGGATPPVQQMQRQQDRAEDLEVEQDAGRGGVVAGGAAGAAMAAGITRAGNGRALPAIPPQPKKDKVLYDGGVSCCMSFNAWCHGIHYRITTSEIEITTGLCCKKVEHIDMWRVTDVGFHSDCMDCCCGTGV